MHDIVGFRSNVDPDKLLKKFIELNNSTNTEKDGDKYCISKQQFETLEDILKFPEKIEENSKIFEDIWENCFKPVLLTWPKDVIFPALDIMRWYLGRKDTSKVNEKIAIDILNVILSTSNGLLSNSPETASRLSLRILSNCFFHSCLHKVLLEQRENIIGIITNIVETSKSISEGKFI